MPPDVDVVIATRDRADEVLGTISRLLALPERPSVLLVDNASSDGTPERVYDRFPDVRVIRLERNLGAAARNVGVRLARAPLVAFSDDDSWWEPGALRLAARLMERHEGLGLVAGRVVLADGSLDRTCLEMERTALEDRPDVPGRRVLGFIACGAVVRRRAFLEAGGFHPRFMVGGEEALLSMDLAAAGWDLAYVPDLVAHHRPSGVRDRSRRRRVVARNDLWTAWLRRRGPGALRRSVRVALAARSDAAARWGLLEALAGVAWVSRERRAVPRWLERDLQQLGQ